MEHKWKCCTESSPVVVLKVFFVHCKSEVKIKMTDSEDLCHHLDSIGEITKEELIQKSKVRIDFAHI